MREVLVAVYSTVAQTDEAVRALEAANIPGASIRRYHRDDPAIRQVGRSIEQPTEAGEPRRGGFWAWLLGEEGQTSDWRHTDESVYGRSIESGNTVLAVDADQADAERVMKIMADHEPIGLEDAGPMEHALPATGAGATSTTLTGTTEAQQRAEAAALREEEVRRTAAVPHTAAAMPATERVTTEREETIPLAEEQVEVGKRQVERPVRVRRYVIERPVEQQVTLKDERVEIERRRPVEGTTAEGGAFEERIVEVHETTEEPVVTKTAAVTEEAVVRREVGERTETVHDTARKEEVEVERDPNTTPPRRP